VYVLSLYFVYVFIDKKDITFFKRIILSVFLLPVIIFLSTRANLENFNVENCEASEGKYYTFYYYIISFIIFLWIFFISISRYRKGNDKQTKKQIFYLAIGIESFLFLFFITGFLASYLDSLGISYAFELEQYGLFGMTFFMAMLAYLIVKFHAFNIKLLAAQALTVAIIILVGSQFFFIRTTTNKILNGITFSLSCAFGWWLVKSVKEEVKRKEELQVANSKLEVANSSLEAANSKLEVLNQAKTNFVSAASHLLRTPITHILGYADLILSDKVGKLSPDQKRYAETIMKSDQEMNQMVDDYLCLSRIEMGTTNYELNKFDPNKLVETVVEEIKPKVKEKKLALEFQKPSSLLPEMFCDEGKLKQIISNLIDNSVKYTKEGGITVAMKPERGFTALNKFLSNPAPVLYRSREKQDIPVAQITISDTGIGIGREELPHLFQMFLRGKDGIRANTKGSGIGLRIAKGFAETLGGQVWAESKGKDQGSKFIIEMPIICQQPEGEKTGAAELFGIEVEKKPEEMAKEEIKNK
jgi:signal transduction histidine kinase